MEVHVGKRIKEELEASSMSVSEFSRRLNCHRQNVYNIFKRQNVDMDLLQRISDVLEYDFMSELFAMKQTPKMVFRFAVTVEIDNGQYHVTKVQPIK